MVEHREEGYGINIIINCNVGHSIKLGVACMYRQVIINDA